MKSQSRFVSFFFSWWHRVFGLISVNIIRKRDECDLKNSFLDSDAKEEEGRYLGDNCSDCVSFTVSLFHRFKFILVRVYLEQRVRVFSFASSFVFDVRKFH